MNNKIKKYFFFLALANAIIIFQFVNMATVKGIESDIALKVYSLMQLNIILSIFLKNYFANKIYFKKIAIITIIIRIILLIIMFISNNQNVFLLSMFLYGFVFSGFDVVNEAIVSVKSNAENQDYGKIRKFYSIGFAINGVIVLAMVLILPYIFIFPLLIILNIICLLLVVKNDFFTVKNQIKKEVVEKTNPWNFQLISFILIIMLIIVTPNLFAVNLNTFIIESFSVSIEVAVFISTLCIIMGSLVSEVYGMHSAGGLIDKFGSKNIIRLSIVLTLIRWCVTLFATSPSILILSYLLHGISFAFAYIGAMVFIDENIHHRYIGNFVSLNTIFASLFIAITLTLFSGSIATNGTDIMVVFNIAVTIFTFIMFEIYLHIYKKNS